jgi:phospholipase/lecithinase/hemolysin
MKRRRVLLSIALVLLVFAPVRAADDGRHGEYSNIYVFGDSLSDNGNFVKLLGPIEQYTPYHYWQGRWSNGPVWAEYLAKDLHANLLDFAVGSAKTDDPTPGLFPVPTVLDQIRSFRASRVNIPADSVFIVQGGANDFLVELLAGPAGNPGTVPTSAVANIMAGVGLLKEAGARHILVMNLPDLGPVPLFGYYGVPAWYMNGLTVAYNQALAEAVSDFAAANHGVRISIIDIYGFTAAIVAQPQKYGLENVTSVSPNAVVAGQFGSNYFFWDWVHPTTKAHEAWARFVAHALHNVER